MAEYNVFKDLKKDQVKEYENYFKKYLIIGSDYYSAKSYLNLINQNSSEDVQLISDVEIRYENFTLVAPVSIRGEENIDVYNQLVGNDSSVSDDALFYKDLKFRKFGGRSRSFKILDGEEFYSKQSVKRVTLPSLTDEEFNQIQSACKTHNVLKIKKIAAEDLIDQANWEVTLSNGKVCQCEELIWGETPLSFYEFLEKEGDVATKIALFCDGLTPITQLRISLEYNKVVTNLIETLFIPLSYTHDHGHYIGEITNLAGSGSQVNFVHFFHHTEINEEELSRKIRHFKKAIDKVFELKGSTILKEYISISHTAFVEQFQDSALHEIEDHFSLHFIGETGHIRKNMYEKYGEKLSKCSHSLRGLLTIIE